jgi:hypothetical protein
MVHQSPDRAYDIAFFDEFPRDGVDRTPVSRESEPFELSG